MTMKRRLCKSCSGDATTGNEPIWAMQPFGPDKDVTFTALGSQYRGFPLIEVCDRCKEGYQAGRQTLMFKYRGKVFSINRQPAVRGSEES